ncbi:MAG TPA: branched-chain amino acid ABC transporter substrate-binding protein [Stellaceae bacterium]|nr:branched-chain amino acid ABC transporter substrate-binding protein [Stellaceae bacterium]
MKSNRLFGIACALALAAGSQAQAADLLIGVVGPMTGQYAAFGDQMRRGAELAVENINKQGGINGQAVKLEVGDDACDPKQAVAVANQLVTKHVVAVIGHYCSGSSIPASAVYNDAGILQITPASTNPALTEDAAKKGWNNVFRVCGRDDKQGVVAGNFINDRFHDKRIAILHDKSAYGKGLADETKKQINSKGIKEVSYDAINAGEKDYTSLITRLKGDRIELVYIGGYHPDVGLIIRQAREQGYMAQFMSGDANATDELGGIAGPAADGFLFTFGPDARKNPAAKSTVEQFTAKGFDPEGYTLYTVAALQVYSTAANATKSTKVDVLSKQIKAGTFKTVIGDLSYDEKGDVKDPKYLIYVWKNGKYAEL